MTVYLLGKTRQEVFVEELRCFSDDPFPLWMKGVLSWLLRSRL